MSKNVKNQKPVELNLVAEVAKRLSNGGLKPADVQSLLEKKPKGESSLDNKIVDSFDGFDFTEANFNETIVYCGQKMKRHRNGGGWVPAEQSQYDMNMPYVSSTAYVDMSSMVSGCARLYDFVIVYNSSRIYDNARLYDETFVNNSRIYGNSLLTGKTYVLDRSRISGNFFGCNLRLSNERLPKS